MKIIIVLCSILLLVPFAALAQVDYCEGNFDYDRDQDGTDAFTFKTDFGRSSLVNPCPPDGPAPVGKTGQIDSYGFTGSDGDLEKGVAWPDPRFTDNLNGTVTDDLTGLIWLRNACCTSFYSGDVTGRNDRDWFDAIYAANNLASGYCGLSDGSSAGDWRLPNRKELFSLVDDSNFIPALPSGHPFENVQFGDYWSSTTYAYSTVYAWIVYMYSGSVDLDLKYYDDYYVWPVRGGQ